MGKVLITGATGFLGMKLSKWFSEIYGYEVIKASRNPEDDGIKIDITDAEDVFRVLESYSPNIVINTAGVTRPGPAEADVKQAFLSNVDGVWNLANTTLDMGSKLVQISTSFVFDGKNESSYDEDSETNPLNVYGLTKKIGEDVAKWNPNHVIVRCPMILGYNGPGKFSYLLTRIEQGEIYKADKNYRRSIVWADDIARGIHFLNRLGHTGTFHFASYDRPSMFQIAKGLEYVIGARGKVVEATPEDITAFADNIRRPEKDYLNSFKMFNLGFNFTPFIDILQQMRDDYLLLQEKSS